MKELMAEGFILQSIEALDDAAPESLSGICGVLASLLQADRLKFAAHACFCPKTRAITAPNTSWKRFSPMLSAFEGFDQTVVGSTGQYQVGALGLTPAWSAISRSYFDGREETIRVLDSICGQK
jgi:hypothetical protein